MKSGYTEMISVIMPVYNAERTVERTIRSILGQTFQDFELIIVDDGSSDGTAEICTKTGSDRIVYCRQQNAGPAAARNLGLAKARGSLICFIDADDTVEEDYLQVLARCLEGADLAVCGFSKVTAAPSACSLEKAEDSVPASEAAVGEKAAAAAASEEKLICESGASAMKLALKDELVGGFLWNKIFRRSLIEDKAVRFDEKLFVGEDLLFVEQYLSESETVHITKKQLYNYFSADDSISHAMSRRNLTLLRALEKVHGLSEDPGFREMAAVRYTRQFLALYPFFPEDKVLRRRFARFRKQYGYSDRRVFALLTPDYRLRFALYRVNPRLYALCMAARRSLQKNRHNK